jgi:hypothetical protein
MLPSETDGGAPLCYGLLIAISISDRVAGELAAHEFLMYESCLHSIGSRCQIRARFQIWSGR